MAKETTDPGRLTIGRLARRAGVAVDGEGRLYVADFFNHRVQLLDAAGGFLRQWGVTGEKGLRSGTFRYPTDVALLADGTLVVADAYNDRIQIFRPDGTFLRRWGGPFGLNLPGGFPGWFRVATGVGVDLQGHIFVADFYNHRIQKFTSNGRFLVAFGHPGTSPGELDRPTDVAVDEEGNLYVVDFGNDRIQVFKPGW